MKCDISKSKSILCEWNAFYFIKIAFIGFTLHEIKRCIVFLGTPGIRGDSLYMRIVDIEKFNDQQYEIFII